MPSAVKSVACPVCQKMVAWTNDNPSRPFCSKRCKLIDFGEWASGRHAIAGEPVITDIEGDDSGDWTLND